MPGDARAGRGAVVVTGASSGIGEACALHLDRLGFRVFAGVLTAAEADAVARRTGGRVTPVVLDVTDAASIAAAAAVVARALGSAGLAGLVNNAGIAVAGPLELVPPAALRRQLEVNVVGPVSVTQAFAAMLRAGRGRVVNIGSILGRIALPFLGPYAASKFALEAISDALRVELRPSGVDVVVVEPARVATPIWQTSLAATLRALRPRWRDAERLYDLALLARHAAALGAPRGQLSPEAVARAVAHALTARRPRTRYLVGAEARVLAALGQWVPDRMRDRLVARALGARGTADAGRAPAPVGVPARPSAAEGGGA
jgi:NAD(P)-dependent dehydrogenase (short-subunit alcohol dehydrogenase family)